MVVLLDGRFEADEWNNSYFGKQTTPKVVNNFYDEIASKSPLPIVSIRMTRTLSYGMM